MKKRKIINCKKLKIDRGYKILITVGLLTLFISGAMGVHLLIDDYMAGYRARLVLEQMKTFPTHIPVSEGTEADSYVDDDMNDINENGIELSPASHPDLESEVTAIITDPESDDTEPADQNESLDYAELAYNSVGILSIPKLKLELPILGECTNKFLKVSICKYMGDVRNNPQKLIIAGHNYRHHFGKLSTLNIGDKISFTSLEGNEYWYSVSEVTEISMYDFSTLLGGEWDISLFTCNSDGKWRILVRCQEIMED